MFAFIIELVGLFSAAIASRLFWLRRDEWQPAADAPPPSSLSKARLGIDVVMLVCWASLIVYAKWVMWWWVALIIIVAFTTAAWVGISDRNRDQFEPAALVFSAMPILAALYLWTN